MKPLITLLQNLIRSKRQKHLSSGFTLLELLIATVMSSIVISSLLYFMIDIIRTNAAETARKNTLQDMRQALEFIRDDLKEAVYVYTGDQLDDRNIGADDGILDIINTSDDDLEPIIVFWKLEDVPYSDNDDLPDDCSDETIDETEQNCEELRISQRTYTLVAYLQDNDPTDTWQGESVIYRYQLRKYFDTEDKPFDTLEQKSEYIDPIKQSSFADWPYDSSGVLVISGYELTVNRGNVTEGGKSDALVDFVDVPDNSDVADANVACPPNFARSTPQPRSTSNSFYACVESVTNNAGETVLANNATVIVNLRGNPDGRVSFDLSDSSPLPTLNSSVVLRGSNR